MTTYAEFKSFYLREIWREGDAALEQDLDRLIARAEAKIKRDLSDAKLVELLEMPIMQSPVALPGDFSEAISVSLDGATLSLVSPDLFHKNTTASSPYRSAGSMYCVVGNNLLINILPQFEESALVLQYYSGLTPFSLNPVAPYYDVNPDFYTAAVNVEVYNYLRDFDLSAEYNGKYAKLLEDMQRRSSYTLFPSGQLITQIPGNPTQYYSNRAATGGGGSGGGSPPYMPFDSYADALAAPKQPALNEVSAIMNRSIVRWVRSPTGTCLGGGWSPADVATPYHWGAVGDGLADDTSEVLAALSSVNDSLGSNKVVINTGKYLITSSLDVAFSADITLEFEAGAQLIAGANLQQSVLMLRGSDVDQATPSDVHLRVINARIDCRNGIYVVGEGSCTALSFRYFSTATIEGGYIYGGEEPDNLNADAGISWTTCGETRIVGVLIRGFADTGIYPGGNNDTTPAGDGGTGQLINVTIQRCNQAVTAKRQMKQLMITGCVFEECLGGVSTQDVSAPASVSSARRIDITGSTFRKIRANAFRPRGDTVGSLKSCTFEDWGFRYDGTSSAGSSAYAVNIDGAPGFDLSNNSYLIKNWPVESQGGYYFTNHVFGAVTTTHGYCYGTGDTFRNLPRAYSWGAVGNPHTFTDVYFENVTTPISTNNYNASTLITYRKSGSHGMWSWNNGQITNLGPFRVVEALTNMTLTLDDVGTTYHNLGAVAEVAITLPGASLTSGATFTFVCLNPIGIRVYGLAGDYIRLPGGTSSASGGGVRTLTRGDTITIKAVDSSVWVVTSYGGSWAAVV